MTVVGVLEYWNEIDVECRINEIEIESKAGPSMTDLC